MYVTEILVVVVVIFFNANCKVDLTRTKINLNKNAKKKNFKREEKRTKVHVNEYCYWQVKINRYWMKGSISLHTRGSFMRGSKIVFNDRSPLT